MDLLGKALAAQETAEAMLARCQDQGGTMFTWARKKVLGWDQRKMADALGVNYQYLSKIENGRLSPGLPILKTLRDVLQKNGKLKS